MQCEEARELMIAHTRHESSAEESGRLAEHLAGCEACREEESRARRMLSVADVAHEARVDERLHDIIERAIAAGASDLHVDPEPDGVAIRFRIDGALREVERHPRLLLQPLVDRLLALAGLSVETIDSARRLPVGGYAWRTIGDREFQLRIGTFPMVNGPKAVVRFIPNDGRRVSLDELGLAEGDRERLKGWISRPRGLVILAGPSGSGKTTTLYTVLEQTVAPISNVLSLEGHVAVRIPGVHQASINPSEGLSYAEGLRAMFRTLDPDVVGVGDVPDGDTARLLPELAITGHLMIACIEAGDAVAAVRRLLDLGADPYTLSMVLVGVLVQRLCRRICPDCRAECPASPVALQALGFDAGSPPNLFSGAGCPACRSRGFRGRAAVYELLDGTPAFAQRIAENAPTEQLAEAASGSLSPLIEDARRKVLAGTTTAEEALRVIRTGRV